MPLQYALMIIDVHTFRPFSPLNRGNASAIWTIGHAQELTRPSVPSIGAMPLQCAGIAANCTKSLPFSPLNRGNASAICSNCIVDTLAIFFQSPQSGQCLCNIHAIRSTAASWTSFSPLNRGNASAITPRAMEACDRHLSVPSIGAMPLQLTTCAKHLPDTASFQSPQSGQCLCNTVHRDAPYPWHSFSPLNRGNASAIQLHRSLPTMEDFQSPQSGQCLCNQTQNWQLLPRQHVFQSPQSGQCLCNDPNCTSNVIPNFPFSPLNRGNASAIYPLLLYGT